MLKRRPWHGFVPEEEQETYRLAGLGGAGGIGERPALLVIDMQYRSVGEEPQPIREAIREYPTSCGEAHRAISSQWQAHPLFLCGAEAVLRSRPLRDQGPRCNEDPGTGLRICAGNCAPRHGHLYLEETCECFLRHPAGHVSDRAWRGFIGFGGMYDERLHQGVGRRCVLAQLQDSDSRGGRIRSIADLPRGQPVRPLQQIRGRDADAGSARASQPDPNLKNIP